MILLEISKEFTNHGRLLGEHQWRHFLKDPTKDEEGHKTCVYYSIYRTCREARKDGTHTIPLSLVQSLPHLTVTQVGILSRHLQNGSRAGHPEQGKHNSFFQHPDREDTLTLLYSRIVSPYPEPKHCPPPPEDRTSKQICRHIPLSTTRQATSPTKTVVPPGIFFFMSFSFPIHFLWLHSGRWLISLDRPTKARGAKP